jgi:hypothetical protein
MGDIISCIIFWGNLLSSIPCKTLPNNLFEQLKPFVNEIVIITVLFTAKSQILIKFFAFDKF